jgi:hypothetical protein
LQIESGVSLEDYRTGPERLQTLSLPGTLFRLAIIKGLELRVGTGVTYELHEIDLLPEPTGTLKWGFDDLSFGTKVQVINGGVQLALIGSIGVPSGSWGDHSPPDLNGVLCLAFDATSRLGFGYNVGISSAEELLFGSVSAAVAVGERAGVFGEFYGGHLLDNPVGLQPPDPFAFDCGVTYLLCPNLQLDFSFGTSITERRNFYSTGLSWRILGTRSEVEPDATSMTHHSHIRTIRHSSVPIHNSSSS